MSLVRRIVPALDSLMRVDDQRHDAERRTLELGLVYFSHCRQFHERLGSSDRDQHVAGFDYRFATWVENHFTIASLDANDHNVEFRTDLRVS